jgi:hypothetical protein
VPTPTAIEDRPAAPVAPRPSTPGRSVIRAIRPPPGRFNDRLFVREILIDANDMVYDPFSKRIYASVGSRVPGMGNSITVVNPLTGEIGPSIFVGSEPNRMVISDDGRYIYVVLDGANTIRRFDVPTRRSGPQFSKGNVGIEDMKVPPGHPDWLVAALYNPGLSPRNAGDNFWIDGVEQPNRPRWGANVLAFAEDGAYMYGLYNELGPSSIGCRILTDRGWGDQLPGNVCNANESGELVYDGGYFFTTTGHLYDLEHNTMIGTFAGARGCLVPEARQGRALYLQKDGDDAVLRGYDITTMLPLGELRIPGVRGDCSRFCRLGDRGYAFRTSGRQILVLTRAPGLAR